MAPGPDESSAELGLEQPQWDVRKNLYNANWRAFSVTCAPQGAPVLEFCFFCPTSVPTFGTGSPESMD